MTRQDVICYLFLLNLQYSKHKQVMPAPAAPTSPCTLSKQLYNGITRCDSPSASVQLHDGRETSAKQKIGLFLLDGVPPQLRTGIAFYTGISDFYKP